MNQVQTPAQVSPIQGLPEVLPSWELSGFGGHQWSCQPCLSSPKASQNPAHSPGPRCYPSDATAWAVSGSHSPALLEAAVVPGAPVCPAPCLGQWDRPWLPGSPSSYGTQTGTPVDCQLPYSSLTCSWPLSKLHWSQFHQKKWWKPSIKARGWELHPEEAARLYLNGTCLRRWQGSKVLKTGQTTGPSSGTCSTSTCKSLTWKHIKTH